MILHSHYKWESISFMWKMTFEIFIKSLCTESEKTVYSITFDRIIELNWALAYFLGAQNLRTSSLTSHMRQKLSK